MRRFILSMIVCLADVLFIAHAVDPARVAARPAGAIISARVAAPADSTAPLDGFSADSARGERNWESKFRALPPAPPTCAAIPTNLRAPAPRRHRILTGTTRSGFSRYSNSGGGTA